MKVGFALLALAGAPALAAVHTATHQRASGNPLKRPRVKGRLALPPPVVRESRGAFAVVIEPGSGQTLVADPRSRTVGVRVWVGGIDPGWPPCSGGGQYPCWIDVLLDGHKVAHLVKNAIPNDYTTVLKGVRVAPRASIMNNVVIGLRGGIHVTSSPYVTVSGDYTDDRYYGGYSQGLNLELVNSPGLLATGDVIRGSSWPVPGLDGELRDSLVMEAGHNWIMRRRQRAERRLQRLLAALPAESAQLRDPDHRRRGPRPRPRRAWRRPASHPRHDPAVPIHRCSDLVGRRYDGRCSSPLPGVVRSATG